MAGISAATMIAAASATMTAVSAVSSFQQAKVAKQEAARTAELARLRGKQEAEAAARRAEELRSANRARMAAAMGQSDSATNRTFLADFDEENEKNLLAIQLNASNRSRAILFEGSQTALGFQLQGLNSAVSAGSKFRKLSSTSLVKPNTNTHGTGGGLVK